MTSMEDIYQEIRPYHDDEVRAVLDSILANPECIAAVTKLRFARAAAIAPWLLKPIVAWVLRRQLKSVQNVHDFQMVVEHYMTHMIRTTTTKFTTSGTEKIDPEQGHLFSSNHRDIALDPAFVNYALYHAGHGTVRIAIGDNLLTKSYVSDLMRLNKSFIVKRSETAPRKLFAALKNLSGYIRHSVTVDNHNVWIAQREGRAKNGIDKTEPAIIKMFAMSGVKGAAFVDVIKELHLVPVSISYEYDPCDLLKANELYEIDKNGVYQKGEQEDVASIALGISGKKGHVHVHFGEKIESGFETAEEVARLMDQQIIANYVLHPSNFFAYKLLHGDYPQGVYSDQAIPFVATKLREKEQEFAARLEACPTEKQRYFLEAYANPIVSKQKLGLM